MATAVADLPDLYEVIDGEIVESEPMSVEAIGCAADISLALGMYGLTNNRGKSYPEMLIHIPEPFNRDRRPDCIFVSYNRWPKGEPLPKERSWEIVPELCVEVVSPTDQADEVRLKIDEYFETGVSLVWVVYPQRQSIDVYDSPSSSRVLRRSDTLSGGDVLPGFSLSLSELFPVKRLN